ncbi:MAG: 2-dehydro-3-deoxyphosphogluconate aldolase / (4S)-4-hydroxy-2-oxoglutarate aldolase, partial [Pseudomonadota bacterium]|nr:2-dehydro-3-deoxyphosphogluconate aldolase / (4S)-4-hydroxy-2-oxoglutarate aldolase [Pseudomonadota bacterium]
MRTIEQIFGTSKIVPGAVLEDPKVALAVAGALLEANVKVMALRLLSRNSLKSLELITKEFPEMMVGASGVMDAAGFLNAS